MAERALTSCVTNVKNSGQLILSGKLVAALEALSLTGKSGKTLENKLDSIVETIREIRNI